MASRCRAWSWRWRWSSLRCTANRSSEPCLAGGSTSRWRCWSPATPCSSCRRRSAPREPRCSRSAPRWRRRRADSGRRPWQVLGSITLPLASRGIAVGMALVFLTTMKELPATLILSPIGFEPLAAQVWSASSEAFFARAALPALLLVLLSAPAARRPHPLEARCLNARPPPRTERPSRPPCVRAASSAASTTCGRSTASISRSPRASSASCSVPAAPARRRRCA